MGYVDQIKLTKRLFAAPAAITGLSMHAVGRIAPAKSRRPKMFSSSARFAALPAPAYHLDAAHVTLFWADCPQDDYDAVGGIGHASAPCEDFRREFNSDGVVPWRGHVCGGGLAYLPLRRRAQRIHG
jgi:hypothetical protein